MMFSHTPENLNKKDQSLWRKVADKNYPRQQVLEQVFFYVPTAEWPHFSANFKPESFRKGHYRTPELGVHLHAVDEGAYINVHIDVANPYGGLIGAVKHFFCDVLVTALATAWVYKQFALRPAFKAAKSPSLNH